MTGTDDLHPQILEFLNSPVKLCASTEYFGEPYNAPEITALHLCARFGLDNLVRPLLLNGHDPNAKDANGNTPLSWAMMRDHEDIVLSLIKAPGIDLNSRICFPAVEKRSKTLSRLLFRSSSHALAGQTPLILAGQTPLIWASQRGLVPVVEILLHSEKVDRYATNEESHDCLWYAAWRNHERVLKLLLSMGKFVPRTNTLSGNSTPAIAQLLLAYDTVNINEKNKNKNTTLSRAIDYENIPLVKFLINREDIDIYEQDKTLEEALCVALAFDKREIMQLMIGTGKIDGLLKNGTFDESLQWVEKHQHLFKNRKPELMLKMLQDAGYVPLQSPSEIGTHDFRDET